MGKINIVFLIDFMATPEGITGGTERQVIDLINNLKRDTFNPVLVCLQEFRKPELWDTINCDKFVLHVYSLFSWTGIAALIQFSRFLRKIKADIVQTFFFDSTLFGVISANLAGVKAIISSRRDVGFWYSKKLLLQLSILNRFTRKILVNSLEIKNNVTKYEKIGQEKVDVIYNGIDFEKYKGLLASSEVNQPDNDSKILSVGIVANYNRFVKRVDLFIKAASLVLANHKGIHFYIVGGGKQSHQKRFLERLCLDLGVQDHVSFLGKKTEAITTIRNFDIGVLTSDSEGFSNVIMEYMASAKPVVATDVGGNRELVQNGKTGFLVPKNDAKKIAEAISKLVENSDLRKRMGQSGYKCISESYAWKKKIREYEAYYLNQLDLMKSKYRIVC